MLSIITAIKNFSFKITNAVFGKTTIFIVIFGWFLAITGILFLAQPEKARKKLLGQGFRIIKGLIIVVLIYLVLMLLSLAGKISNGLISFILWIFIIGLIFGYFFFLKKVYKKLMEKFALIPMKALKIYAVIQIIVGALMVMWQKRIW